MYRIFVVDAADNVATNVADAIPRDTSIEAKGETIKTLNDIPYGHKVALQPIPKGTTVLKYGLSIGNATADIQKGEHVHTHNVESNRGRGDKA
jgi:altronate dehydratase small subunit